MITIYVTGGGWNEDNNWCTVNKRDIIDDDYIDDIFGFRIIKTYT